MMIRQNSVFFIGSLFFHAFLIVFLVQHFSSSSFSSLVSTQELKILPFTPFSGGNGSPSKKQNLVRNKSQRVLKEKNHTAINEKAIFATPQEATRTGEEVTAGLPYSSGSSSSPTIMEYFQRVRQTNPEPDYPRLARLKGIEGKVVLKVQISVENPVEKSITIAHSSGSDLLDQTALNAVKNWNFPSIRHYLPSISVEHIECLIPFKFLLEKE